MSGGIEFYIHNLLRSLAEIDQLNSYYIFTNNDNHSAFKFKADNFQWIRSNIYARPQVKRVFWEQLFLPFAAIRYRLDVLHSPSYTWPLLSPVPGVVTICDMLYKHYPETIQQPKRTFWQVSVPWSAKRCRKVITISHNSKRDIVKHLGVPADKVIVTPLALDSRILDFVTLINADEKTRVCNKYSIKRPFILNVGGLGKHKNAAALIRAFSELKKHSVVQETSLVITGNDYGSKQELEALALSLGILDQVCFPGYVEHTDLPALYSAALIYASTSRFEGFGLTLLEAMAFGVPVISSNRSSLPEVAGYAADIIDPDDIAGLASVLKKLLTDPSHRQKLRQRSLERVKDFSWETTALLTLEAYKAAKKDV
ncbi:MAG: glycosyltransferase family 1 protein [Chloroflexota bacterium]